MADSRNNRTDRIEQEAAARREEAAERERERLSEWDSKTVFGPVGFDESDKKAALAEQDENVRPDGSTGFAGAKQDVGERGARQRDTSPSANTVGSDEIFTAADHSWALPDNVQRQYLKVGKNDFHFRNASAQLAFTDWGNKLRTPSNSNFVARSLVLIALARGWDEIKVTGSEAFKRQVWIEAAERGMTVRGYTPTEVDKAKVAELRAGKPVRFDNRASLLNTGLPRDVLRQHPELAGAFAIRRAVEARCKQENLTPEQTKRMISEVDKVLQERIERGDYPRVARRSPAAGVSGQVADFGAARYNFEPSGSQSFYVKVQTDSGERVLWGKDLERAVQEAELTPGEQAHFKREGRTEVTVDAPVKDESGRIVGTEPIQTYRNRWNVERLQEQLKRQREEEEQEEHDKGPELEL